MSLVKRDLDKEDEINDLVRQLADQTSYNFTKNYSGNYARFVWKFILAEFKGKENIRALEIGSYEGRSAIWFLENVLTNEEAKITCIDPFFHPLRELRFDHNIRISGFSEKVIKIKDFSEAVLFTFPKNSFDFIYIDGSHLAVNVLMDAFQSWNLLKLNGILIFDDYQWELNLPAHERPQMAIDIFLEIFDEKFEVLHKSYQVIIRKI